jgi:hypothetical protein
MGGAIHVFPASMSESIAINLHVFPSVWGSAASRDASLQVELNSPGVLIRLGTKQRRRVYHGGLYDG